MNIFYSLLENKRWHRQQVDSVSMFSKYKSVKSDIICLSVSY